jgi:hypothetical protein
MSETKELSIGQRLAADTPTFFKKVELVGLAVLGIAGSLSQIQGLPYWLQPLLLGIGGMLTLIPKFTIKDTSVLANPNATIEDYSAVLADLPNQFKELHAGIANTVASINAGKVTPEVPVTETPIVKVPEVPIVEIPKYQPPIPVVENIGTTPTLNPQTL